MVASSDGRLFKGETLYALRGTAHATLQSSLAPASVTCVPLATKAGVSAANRLAAVALALLLIAAPHVAYAQSWQQIDPGSGSSSGGGSICYYTDSASCSAGFSAMGGNYHSDNTSHIICCAGDAVPSDSAPDSFNFANKDTSSLSTTQIESNAIQMTGLTSATVSISGEKTPEYRICNDGSCTDVVAAWGNSDRTIYDNQYVQVRNSSSDPGDYTATVSVGSESDDFTHSFAYTAFVTSYEFTGSQQGVSGVNQECQDIADMAGLDGTYEAWIATSDSNDPNDRFGSIKGTLAKIIMPGDVKLADSWSDLTDGSIDNAFEYNENGNVDESEAWSNVNMNGDVYNTANDAHCEDWSTNSSSQTGNHGRGGDLDGWSIDVNGQDSTCDTLKPFFCFEQ